jgi:hypothetical protein
MKRGEDYSGHYDKHRGAAVYDVTADEWKVITTEMVIDGSARYSPEPGTLGRPIGINESRVRNRHGFTPVGKLKDSYGPQLLSLC